MSTQRSARIAGALGLGSVALVVAGLLITFGPAPTGDTYSDREIVSYFTDHRDDITLGTLIVFVGVIAFLVFVALLREVLRRAERDGGNASGLALAAGVAWSLFMVAGCWVLGAIPGALDYAKPFTVDPDTARLLMSMTWTPFVVLAGVAAAVLVGATSVSARRTGALPRRFARAGYVVAPLVFIGAFAGFYLVLFPLWLVALCVILIARAGAIRQPTGAPEQRPPTVAAESRTVPTTM